MQTSLPPVFRVVQPWDPDKARQATLVSEHPTAAKAFAEIDRLSAQMVAGARPAMRSNSSSWTLMAASSLGRG
jgi:hypothetical protein